MKVMTVFRAVFVLLAVVIVYWLIPGKNYEVIKIDKNNYRIYASDDSSDWIEAEENAETTAKEEAKDFCKSIGRKPFVISRSGYTNIDYDNNAKESSHHTITFQCTY